MGKAYNEKTEELYVVKEDVRDVHSRGLSSMALTKTAMGHPQVRYEDKITGKAFVMTCDVYNQGGEIMVHMICPRCRHNLSIRSSNKSIQYDPERENLSVEPFKCTWELNDELLGDRRDWGFSLCNWSVAIDNNLAKET